MYRIKSLFRYVMCEDLNKNNNKVISWYKTLSITVVRLLDDKKQTK